MLLLLLLKASLWSVRTRGRLLGPFAVYLVWKGDLFLIWMFECFNVNHWGHKKCQGWEINLDVFRVTSLLKALERGEKTVGAIFRIPLPAFPTGSSQPWGWNHNTVHGGGEVGEGYGSINRNTDWGMHGPDTLQSSLQHILLVQIQLPFLLPAKHSLTFPTTQSWNSPTDFCVYKTGIYTNT